MQMVRLSADPKMSSCVECDSIEKAPLMATTLDTRSMVSSECFEVKRETAPPTRIAAPVRALHNSPTWGTLGSQRSPVSGHALSAVAFIADTKQGDAKANLSLLAANARDGRARRGGRAAII